MKSIFTLLFSFILIGIATAQDVAIKFEEGDWQSALDKAKAENKLIFVDAYTTWCGPCKMMAKNIFTQKEVGQVYNTNFINVKLDMEKGEGVDFAQEYGVRAYPTFVFVDQEGNLAHKGIGYMESDVFISLADAALDEENRLGTQVMRYENGDREAEFMKNYAQVLQEVYDPLSSRVALEYLNAQKNWKSRDNAKFIAEMLTPDPESPIYQYAINNRSDILPFVDAKEFDDKIKNTMMRQYDRNKTPQNEIKENYDKIFEEKGQQYYDEYVMLSSSRIESPDMVNKYIHSAIHYMNSYETTDWRMLNSAAWRFYEHATETEHLENAVKWALLSIQLDSNSFNNDTAAALYYKLGNKVEATKYAKRAINIAKEQGRGYESTNQLLEKINAL